MDSVINTVGNIVSSIIGGIITASSGLSATIFFAILSGFFLLVALLLVWVLIRMRHARRVKAAFNNVDLTFDDVSAEAAMGQTKPAEIPLQKQPAAATPAAAAPAAGMTGNVPESAPAEGESQPTGFRFFKRKTKREDEQPVGEDAASADDDIYLLGLEQEMLATRQLYLDGLITKEVYVTETRALYDKAQSRMT